MFSHVTNLSTKVNEIATNTLATEAVNVVDDDIVFEDAVDKINSSFVNIDKEIHDIELLNKYSEIIKVHGFHASSMEFLKANLNNATHTSVVALESAMASDDIGIEAVMDGIKDRINKVVEALKVRVARVSNATATRLNNLKDSITSLVSASRSAKEAKANGGNGISLVTATKTIGTISAGMAVISTNDTVELVTRVIGSGSMGTMAEANKNPYRVLERLRKESLTPAQLSELKNRSTLKKATDWSKNKFMAACMKVSELYNRLLVFVNSKAPSVTKAITYSANKVGDITGASVINRVRIMTGMWAMFVVMCATLIAKLVSALWQVGRSVFDIKVQEAN